MFLRAARVSAMLAGSAGGAAAGWVLLKDDKTLGGGLPGGVVDSSASGIESVPAERWTFLSRRVLVDEVPAEKSYVYVYGYSGGGLWNAE